MASKYALPDFLVGRISQEAYAQWLSRKAAAHLRRNRKRDYLATGAAYREAIHQAVLRSAGKDDYTGEELHWQLISTYANDESKTGRHAYKAGFALLPTVDHVASDATEASFKICA